MAKEHHPHHTPSASLLQNHTNYSVETIIQQSIDLYQQGKIQEALTLSEQAFNQFPDNTILISNAAAFAMIIGSNNTALNYFLKALDIDSNNSETHNNLGQLYVKFDKLSDAEQSFNNAIMLKPDFAEAHFNLGCLQEQHNQLLAAEISYKNTINCNPNHFQALAKFASILTNQKRFLDAIEPYRNIIRLQPDNAELRNNLGLLLTEVSQLSDAEQSYLNALSINPDYSLVHYNLGVLYTTLNRLQEAENSYKKAVKIDPTLAKSHYNLGNLYKKNKQFINAEQSYKDAIQNNPDYTDAHNNLGLLLYEQNRLTDAEESYQNALKTHQDNAEIYNNQGLLFAKKKCFSDAENSYQKAFKDTSSPHTITNYAFLLLSQGKYSEGWQAYESRYHPDKKDRNIFPPKTNTPQWQGQSLANKKLLIYPEQGLGDEIQFIRYLPLIKRQNPKQIILVCKKPLKSLFETLEDIDKIISSEDLKEEDFQNIDYWVFIMSLPLHFKTTVDTIPAQLPYLSADPERQTKWAKLLPSSNFRVGLVWKGSHHHKNDSNRSLPSINTLQPLLNIKEVSFISLQIGTEEANSQPFQTITSLGNKINDFSDTAAIISQLDLIICVDTANAHLAGALNKPCWVLLPFYDTDWRWMNDRNDSPWYPEIMSLFRQAEDNNWGKVIEDVAKALQQEIRSLN